MQAENLPYIGVDSLSRFLVGARTHRHRHTESQMPPYTHASATPGVGNYSYERYLLVQQVRRTLMYRLRVGVNQYCWSRQLAPTLAVAGDRQTLAGRWAVTAAGNGLRQFCTQSRCKHHHSASESVAPRCHSCTARPSTLWGSITYQSVHINDHDGHSLTTAVRWKLNSAKTVI